MESTFIGGYIHNLLQKRREPRRDSQDALEKPGRAPIYDELTGFYSQAYLTALLEQEKARAERGQGAFCVGIVGIDGFDLVDDFCGPAAGESVLRHVGAAIAVELRRADTVSRYGDDEFVFVLFHTGLDNASIPAERVRRRISSLEISSLQPARKVTASIGLAEFKRGEEVATLMGRAASALDRAGGRNRIEIG
ncbi:MAG: GGDEF domain-containing protein [Betaproteobacteria bacterium]|nr:GGDEF domain-containing protein [Betaproteobacteria bacterium]